MQQPVQTLELRDIHLPDAPGYWPLAPGWWLLIALACVVAFFIYKVIKRKRHLAYLNNLVQKQLQQINTDFAKHNNKHKLAAEISELLNRFVRHILHDLHASSYTGDAWINYLNAKVGNDMFSQFSKELTQAQYEPDLDFDVPSLIATVKNYFPQALRANNNA